MAAIQLISVKLKEENSYFYDNNGATIEKRSGEEGKKEETMSKKERRASEREEKKEKKKREKEQKKQEKEMKKNSKKMKEKGPEKKSGEEARGENGGVSRHVNIAASVETLEERKGGQVDGEGESGQVGGKVEERGVRGENGGIGHHVNMAASVETLEERKGGQVDKGGHGEDKVVGKAEVMGENGGVGHVLVVERLEERKQGEVNQDRHGEDEKVVGKAEVMGENTGVGHVLVVERLEERKQGEVDQDGHGEDEKMVGKAKVREVRREDGGVGHVFMVGRLEERKREEVDQEGEREDERVVEKLEEKGRREVKDVDSGLGHVFMMESVERLDEHRNIVGEPEGSPSSGEEHSALSVQDDEPMRAERAGHVIEETIAAVGVEEVEDVPPDTMYQKREIVVSIEPPAPDIEHVEIEISDITDMEEEPASGHVTYISSMEGEGEIMVVTVQDVESGPELDDLFQEMLAQGDAGQASPKRKSVRFEEEHEEIGVYEGHDEKEELSDPVVETMTKEERQNVESSELNWDDIFAEDNKGSSGTPEDHQGSREVVVDHRSSIETSLAGGEHDIERNNNEVVVGNGTAGRHGKKGTKKDKSERSKLWRCCYP